MSGGTLIALAADEIVMTPYSVLGPIDPQLRDLPAASLIKDQGGRAEVARRFALAAAILSLGAVYWLVKDEAGGTRLTASDARTEGPIDQA
jgi:ClpP class serine protease